MVSNHLAIRNFIRMDTSVSRVHAYLDHISLSHIPSNQQDRPKKLLTTNWRGIKVDIKHLPMFAKKPREDGDLAEDDKFSGTNAVDPENDPMAWLDDGLRDLSGSQHAYFAFQTQFDISRYIGVLVDSVSEWLQSNIG